ncbi:hypothetical protein SVAN01_00175 [Stagonosporopsis vannaccii]|nr:hypothetical protein SVAN01_00175 [Stagonosporopsis vannaccii]
MARPPLQIRRTIPAPEVFRVLSAVPGGLAGAFPEAFSNGGASARAAPNKARRARMRQAPELARVSVWDRETLVFPSRRCLFCFVWGMRFVALFPASVALGEPSASTLHACPLFGTRRAQSSPNGEAEQLTAPGFVLHSLRAALREHTWESGMAQIATDR